MNGVSKKLCVTAASIAAVVQLADGAPPAEKWKYAAVIGGLCVIYKIIQGILDYKAAGKAE